MRTRPARPHERAALHRAIRRWHGRTIPNGRPSKAQARPERFDQEQLAIGVAVELEHTRRPEMAMQIAMAHLLEMPDYYARLESVERR
jgi:hypothetical protein